MPLMVLGTIYGYLVWVSGRQRVTETHLMGVIYGITALLYLAAMADGLRPVAAALYWGGVLLLGSGCLRAAWRRRMLAPLTRPGLVVFFILAGLFYLRFHDARLFFWDEFSHWGLATKVLNARHALETGQQVVPFAHYPPAVNLWHTFVNVGGYDEGTTLFAHFMLVLAPLTVMFHRVTWRQAPLTIAVLILILFLMASLGQGSACLYADHVVAVVFGAVMVAGMDRTEDPARLLWLLAPLAVLPLIKTVGGFFAAAAAVTLAVVHGLPPRPNRRRWTAVALSAALLLAPLLAGLSWRHHCQRWDLRPPEDPTPAVSRHLTATQRTVAERFVEVLRQQPLTRTPVSYRYNEFSYGIRHQYADRWRLSTLGWVAAALALFVPVLVTAPDRRRDTAVIMGGMALTTVTFLLLMLYLYLFVFTPRAGLRLASYVRYANTAVLPLAMVALSLYLPATGRWSAPSAVRRAGWTFMALTALALIWERPYLTPLAAPRPPVAMRRVLVAPLATVHRHAAPDDRILVVFPVRGNGFYRVVLRYELAPLAAAVTPAAVAQAAPDELRRLVADYDLVWCLACPDAFQRRHAALLGLRPPGQRVYRVTARDPPRLTPL